MHLPVEDRLHHQKDRFMSLLRTVSRTAAIYLAATMLGFLFYVASFRLPFGGSILFYRGVLLAGITAMALLSALVILRNRVDIDVSTVMGATFTSFAFNVCFLVLFPVTIDRSISVFILSRIVAEDGMTTDEITRRFEDEYLHRMAQMDRRVDEQTISGNVRVRPNGQVVATDQGRKFVELAKSASGWFHTDRRVVDAGIEKPRRK
jgi:hypothetical protein